MPRTSRSTVLLWGLVGHVVLVVGGRSLLPDGGRGAAAAGPGAGAGSAVPSISQPPVLERVVVDVAGAVRRPGVYRLRGGARVQDALRRAGGLTARADPATVNRAAKVADGQQVLVPSRAPAGRPAGPGAPAAAAGAPVSLNGATVEQLDTLDGVGPATAEKIVAWRTANGGFASVDDLAQVPGIGPKKLEALRPRLTP